MAKLLFTWRWAVCSADGPPSTTRLVLCVLSNHMNPDGGGAFPSIATLAKETGLSERAVGTHLKIATRAGWIQRKLWRSAGKDWASYCYCAALPAELHGANLQPRAVGRQSEPHAAGTEAERNMVRNDVPTNTAVNSINNTTYPADQKQRKRCPPPPIFHDMYEKLKRQNMSTSRESIKDCLEKRDTIVS